MIEVQVALVVFGIALAGLAPYMVMYTKQLRVLQRRFSPTSSYYLVPAIDAWTLAAGCGGDAHQPGPRGPSAGRRGALLANVVQLESLEKSLLNEQITAHITIQTAQP